jgi:hypothetical protein
MPVKHFVPKELTCLNCSKIFTQVSPRQKFCRSYCRRVVADKRDKRKNRQIKRELEMYKTLVTILFSAMLFSTNSSAHDYKRPDLDNWYANLHRMGFAKCCDKTDCHVTEAEIRKGKWWARLGEPHVHYEVKTGQLLGIDWTPGPFKEVPDDTIVKDENGHSIANPEGEAVICHQVLTKLGGAPDYDIETVYCFVPPNES